jgi:hypothetical protein
MFRSLKPKSFFEDGAPPRNAPIVEPPLLSPQNRVGGKEPVQKDGRILVRRRGGTLENMNVKIKT